MPDSQPEDAETHPFTYSAIRMLRQAAFMVSPKGRITECNASAENLFGYPREELVDHGLYKVFLPDKPREFAKTISEQINKHRCWIGKSSFYRKDGTRGRLSIELVPHDDFGHRGFVAFMREITETASPAAEPVSVKAEPSPTPPSGGNAAAERTLHQAKNDIQILTSLLNLQAESADTVGPAKAAMQEGRDRVAIVNSVYRLLKADTGTVPFRPLAQDITQAALTSHGDAVERVTFNIMETSPTNLVQKHAIPLGLLLGEILRSALLDSLPSPIKGHISISLHTTGEDGLLVVQDNGPVQSAAIRELRKNSIGGRVQSAVAQQLRAEVSQENTTENEVRVKFRLSN